MKAAVCYEYGKPLVIEDVDIDPPKKREVKVKLAATAVCHSDIHIIKGELFGGKLPIIAGHESAGYVVEVGEGVTQVKVGDPVVLSLLCSCGECRFCTMGLPHMCEYKWPLNTESRLHNKQGQSITHRPGPPHLPNMPLSTSRRQYLYLRICRWMWPPLLACGVITGFGAVVNRAGSDPVKAQSLLVAVESASTPYRGPDFCGAYPIIAVDVLDNKLQMARNFGATHTINAKNTDSINAVRE